MSNAFFTPPAVSFPTTRLRRLRGHPCLRDLIRENRLTVNDLVMPFFVRHGKEECRDIPSMPGQSQLSVDRLASEVAAAAALGIRAVLLFGIPEVKDLCGSDAFSDGGIVQRAVRTIKEAVPEMLIITDICCCEFTDHGHCGIISDHTGHPDVDNEATLKILAKQAVSHARAGADIVAPSGMADGMVAAIRTALDNEGFSHLPILSYSIKYASALYSPFREAAEGAPRFGDRRTYQMDPANGRESLREAELDIAEGADILMVKPAGAYLDVIYKIKTAIPHVPLAAYQVSGEFAMIKAAAAKGWIDERPVVMELLTGIKRAGADFIITYFAKEVATWLRQESVC